MTEKFLLFLGLLALIVALMMLANRLKIAYPILLVLGGLAISFVPNLPHVRIDPQLIFIVFLPPLLYEAAWAVSFKEFWKWRRMIGGFAFVVVFITAAAVALVANWLIPGFSLALGFLLGAIVSPPDAVSAAVILKFVKVPKRVSAILEGESLLNDASSLIIFRFAAVAVTTGQFVWYEAVGSFIWMIAGGVGAGLAVAFIVCRLHKILPFDANMDTILTLMTPYAMYILAEEIHSSGVLAVVTGGLYLSTKRNEMFDATTRTHAVPVWRNFIFILNGLVFALIGLDLPQILEGLQREGVSLITATGYGLLVTAVLIVVRIFASYGAAIVTLIMKNFIEVADDKYPGNGAPLVIGWAGMRGVVSLASALSIPIMAGTQAFPHRDLILFITFVAILMTLVVQGLTLSLLIKKAKMPEFDDHMPATQAETLIRKTLAQASLNFMQSHFKNDESFLLQLRKKAWSFQVSADSCGITADAKERYFAILSEQRRVLA
ncbi:Na+/H+ antiporter [Campylobacter curvus]|uniref:Na+/H+ antiporter n=1 Tax=Campylobacter curvus TaxID=200 RepID=UPI00039BD075|nr:Na+/H+ antiporter [Campylobacter curvus]QKF61922.1 sodium:proton antiporter [Campylobacter curvus]UEB50212.1 Na+/H+ antiporter [Campylobacter curvus]